MVISLQLRYVRWEWPHFHIDGRLSLLRWKIRRPFPGRTLRGEESLIENLEDVLRGKSLWKYFGRGHWERGLLSFHLLRGYGYGGDVTGSRKWD
ncbi:hypothetical protein CEXT_462481 [Caerostris extrusa]|uniref:Uncharacterized protein n=1 Tax=Caerostris extrusa TaxID=172846 RepID=A0AAV4WP79_CAEEX|nr:hypothetical protein CEXT_462481 [Caerostris extrusa]